MFRCDISKVLTKKPHSSSPFGVWATQSVISVPKFNSFLWIIYFYSYWYLLCRRGLRSGYQIKLSVTHRSNRETVPLVCESEPHLFLPPSPLSRLLWLCRPLWLPWDSDHDHLRMGCKSQTSENQDLPTELYTHWHLGLHSMSFCLLSICTAHVECMLYLFVVWNLMSDSWK